MAYFFTDGDDCIGYKVIQGQLKVIQGHLKVIQGHLKVFHGRLRLFNGLIVSYLFILCTTAELHIFLFKKNVFLTRRVAGISGKKHFFE